MTIRHGLSIGIERQDNLFYLFLKATGKLTHEDYQVITPMIDGALEQVSEPIIRAVIDGSELEGWEARAAWDDFKLGLKHGKEFEKIAIYGNKPWQQTISKVANWFVAGEVKFFEDHKDALKWIKE